MVSRRVVVVVVASSPAHQANQDDLCFFCIVNVDFDFDFDVNVIGGDVNVTRDSCKRRRRGAVPATPGEMRGEMREEDDDDHYDGDGRDE